MAYPLDANYEVRTSGVTTIKKTWGDATDLSFQWIFQGLKSLKKFVVDGTGAAATTYLTGTLAKIIGGALQLEGATGDQFPLLRTVRVPTAFAVLWELTGTARKLRFYQMSTGGLLVTVNAQWETPNTGKWTTDNGDTAVAYLFEFDHLRIYTHATGNWTDTALANWSLLTELNTVTGGVNAAQGSLLAGNGALTVGLAITSTGGDFIATLGNFIATALNGEVRAHRITGTGTAPGALAGTGAGATPPAVTVGASSTDQAGTLSLVCAGAPVTGGVVVTVTFHTNFPTGARVYAIPDSDATWLLYSGLNGPCVIGDMNLGTWTITGNAGVPLIVGSTYKWRYYVA